MASSEEESSLDSETLCYVLSTLMTMEKVLVNAADITH